MLLYVKLIKTKSDHTLMSEILNASPGSIVKAPVYKGDQENALKELGPRQREILDLQLAEYTHLNEIELHSDLRDRLITGDTTLPTGTLIHGTTFSTERIESIAAHGVVSGELFDIPEDSETHYCADFFRLEKDMTIAEYTQEITENETSGKFTKPRAELKYIPSPQTHRTRERLAFIIDSTIPGVKELLEADAYRRGTDELFVGIVNHLPVDKNTQKAERLSAVMVGVPRGAIAGIVVSGGLAGNSEHLADLVRAFGEDMPVLSVRGELLNQVTTEM